MCGKRLLCACHMALSTCRIWPWALVNPDSRAASAVQAEAAHGSCPEQAGRSSLAWSNWRWHCECPNSCHSCSLQSEFHGAMLSSAWQGGWDPRTVWRAQYSLKHRVWVLFFSKNPPLKRKWCGSASDEVVGTVFLYRKVVEHPWETLMMHSPAQQSCC